MKIYIDSDFKCHLVDTGGLTAVETDFFVGKCDAYIEGYRFVRDTDSSLPGRPGHGRTG